MNHVDLFFISDTWSVDTTLRSWVGPTCSPSNFNYLASKLGLSKGKRKYLLNYPWRKRINADICAVLLSLEWCFNCSISTLSSKRSPTIIQEIMPIQFSSGKRWSSRTFSESRHRLRTQEVCYVSRCRYHPLHNIIVLITFALRIK